MSRSPSLPDRPRLELDPEMSETERLEAIRQHYQRILQVNNELEDRLDDGTWVLDLNRAYNPTCAYNPAYECPLVPASNWLEVPIEAGERDFPGEVHGHA